MTTTKRHALTARILLLIFLPSLLPVNALYASNNGPGAPEAAGFESVNATDMVNLASGDMAYVLPVMDVDGFPVSLSYHGGIPLDLESTWTGLGWNLNTGAINRGVNAAPDDWRGGNSMDFIRFKDSETSYTVNVGVGIASVAEVGVGASWGANKAMSGSVFASVGVKGTGPGASASIDTDGNYSLGVSYGGGGGSGASFGGGISMSGNVSTGKKSYGVGAGLRTGERGMTMGVGASLDGGMSASLGYASGYGSNTLSGAASMSTSSFSSGDWDVSTSGFYVPIQIYIISFGFGKQKVTYNLKKAYQKAGFGILYSGENNTITHDAIEIESNPLDYSFADYQNRYRYSDSYDQGIPQSEEEFIADYDAEREKINFTYAGYDTYDINATGISGVLEPKILQNSTLYGLGYSGTDANSTNNGKLRIYNHNSRSTTKKFGTNTTSEIKFYFNGQYTQNRAITPSSTQPSSNPTSLHGFLTPSSSPNLTRLKQGNYVEVFTNEQIKNGQATGLLEPLNPSGDGTALEDKLTRNSPEYKDEGIGGYKITAADGKVYHFSQPVYHFEQVERTILKDKSQKNVSEKRQYSSYATHWLLTAITGPDFIDVNNNNVADQDDYGYWTRMDYGKWSDGFIWRTPTDKTLFDYNTNLSSKINKDDFGTFQFGRKQIYYLDRVVSAVHTAYFVKDLRYDAMGCDLSYSYSPPPTIPITANFTNDGTPLGTETINPSESGFQYKRQMQLVLDKIILVKNKDAIIGKGSPTNSLQLSYPSSSNGDNVKSYQPGFDEEGGFYQENNSDPVIKINCESSVYDIRDFQAFDYDTAIKVVDLEYNYNLAVKDHTNNLSNPTANKSKGSPGTVYSASKNPNAGKLCLKSVKFLGRNNYDYMPPYNFEYNGEYKGSSLPYIKYPANAIVQKSEQSTYAFNFNGQQLPLPAGEDIPIENIRAKDEWGFLKDPSGVIDVAATAWTMNKITTPTGAIIKIESEEDDFYTEAFSRRFWTNNLKFKATNIGTQIKLEIEEQDGLQNNNGFDFDDYFGIGDQIFLDLWLTRSVAGSDSDSGSIDVNTANTCIVSAVNGDRLTLLITKINSSSCSTETIPGYTSCTLWGDNVGLVLNNFFSLDANDAGSNDFITKARGKLLHVGNCGFGCDDHWNMKYKLLASKVPSDRTGGGVRVKSITLQDENNNQYKTAYYYNVPASGASTVRAKTAVDYKSSGITSYAPVRGSKFVPYQSELPGPGVMYEYVTMVAQDQSSQTLGETRYRFHVLRPVLNIFDANIDMKDDEGVSIFKAIVDESANYQSGYAHLGKKIKSKSIKVEVNTSLIGQFRSIEEFNTSGQLMSKTEKKYLSGTELKARNNLAATSPLHIDKGSITESFQNMKSIFTTNSNNGNLTLKERLLSISSKEHHASILQSVITTGMHGQTRESYLKTDPETGAFLVVETQKSNGTPHQVERVPAYKNYPEMGPKSISASNKNMLSQEAMVVTSASLAGQWRTLSASLTSWNQNWKYRDNFGAEVTPTQTSHKVWRKHKTFVWKENLQNGALPAAITGQNAQFNWTDGVPLNTSWIKTSEVTRYNHFSSPMETRDINGNFSSNKTADVDDKIIASGNARFTEMYFSGAEHVVQGNLFAGEVYGADHRSSVVAHTGSYSVKANSTNDKLFEVIGSSGPSLNNAGADYNFTFRPGMYKISFWKYKNSTSVQRPGEGTALPWNPTSNLYFNGEAIPVRETVDAGCWQQLNYYITIPANRPNNSITVYAILVDESYFDDFRMHPIASGMTSYVYDQKTDALSYILDGNNMGAAYKYDNAGRLTGQYVETFDTPQLTGGFRITSQVRQKFKGSNDIGYSMEAKINNCLAPDYGPLAVSISTECLGTYYSTFNTAVSGGSGNFKYEYSWLSDPANDVYSDYTVGSASQPIPYAAEFCNEEAFNKKWKFKVKVTDLNNGNAVEDEYEHSTTGCQYTAFDIAEMQISQCERSCEMQPYAISLFTFDPKLSSQFKYEISYIDRSRELNDQEYIDITEERIRRCPILSKVADSNSRTGYRDYLDMLYRVTNLETGEQSVPRQIQFFGKDADVLLPLPLALPGSTAVRYIEEGNMITSDIKGNVLRIVNVNEQIK